MGSLSSSVNSSSRDLSIILLLLLKGRRAGEGAATAVAQGSAAGQSVTVGKELPSPGRARLLSAGLLQELPCGARTGFASGNKGYPLPHI